jgi:hypothetical protein
VANDFSDDIFAEKSCANGMVDLLKATITRHLKGVSHMNKVVVTG